MEVNFEFRGEYYPSFFSIYLNGDFENDFTLLDDPDLGTLAHEYCHYLQNIDTLLGVTESQSFFILVTEIRNYISKASAITLPLSDFNSSQASKDNKNVFDKYRGYSYPAPNLTLDYDDLTIQIIDDNVFVKFNKNNAEVKCIQFGNACVKEGMAHFFQLIFNQKVQHTTVPYLVSEAICKKFCPEISSQTTKLILLSFISLECSTNSGLTFYNLIKEIKRKKKYYLELSDLDFYKFIKESLEVTINKKTYKSVMEAKLFALEQLEEVMSNSLFSEMKYFKSIFQSIREINEGNRLGFADILTMNNLNKYEILSELFKIYKSPNIRTSNYKNIFPDYSNELIELVGQKLTLDRILHKLDCKYFDLCRNQVEDNTDEHCFGLKWNSEKQCPFTLTFNLWGLNTKSRW